MEYALLVVVGFIAFMLFSDKKQEVSRVRSQGGIEQKYKILIDHFKGIPRMQTERKSQIIYERQIKYIHNCVKL